PTLPSVGPTTALPTRSRRGCAGLQDQANLSCDSVCALPLRQSELPQATEVALKELHVVPVRSVGWLHGCERYEQARGHRLRGPHVCLPVLIVSRPVVFTNSFVKNTSTTYLMIV